jgi:hypothetical protein
MEERELIELIDEAIHTGGQEMTDEAVLDYIGRLMAEREQVMNCNCCGLSLEVLDGSPFCHYCYLRECVVNPGRCENARLRGAN